MYSIHFAFLPTGIARKLFLSVVFYENESRGQSKIKAKFQIKVPLYIHKNENNPDE